MATKPKRVNKPRGSKSGKQYGAVSEKQRLILTDNTTDVLLVGGGR